MVQASVRLLTQISQKPLQQDPSQILCKAYLPYLQTVIFSLFKIFDFQIFMNF